MAAPEHGSLARSRLQVVALIASLAMLAAGVGGYLAVALGGGSNPSAGTPFGAPAQVLKRPGMARLAFTYRVSEVGGCIPASNSPVTTGLGSIDLIHHDLAVITRTTGCRDLGSQPAMAQRWVGGAFYEALAGSRSAKPWTRLSGPAISSAIGPNAVEGLFTSPWLASILPPRASIERRLASAAIGGTGEVEFSGTTSLEQVDTKLAAAVPGAASSQTPVGGGQLTPPASAIPVSVQVWLDRQDHLRRLQVSQPLYTGIYQDGSDVEEATRVPTRSMSYSGPRVANAAPQVEPLRVLRQQATFELDVELSSYGAAPAITAPPSSTVRTLSGPAVRPPQAASVTAAGPVSNHFGYCPVPVPEPFDADAAGSAVAAALTAAPSVYKDLDTAGFEVTTASPATPGPGGPASGGYGVIPYGTCGPTVGGRTYVVELYFPAMAGKGADLSHGQLFVSRFPQGWQVWERYH